MDFDYEAPNVPDSAVSDIAAEMANAGKPLPLTLEQIEQRKLDAQLHALACLQRDEERRYERERQRVEAEEEAKRQAAIVARQQSDRALRDMRDRNALQSKERYMRDLGTRIGQQELRHAVYTHRSVLDTEMRRREPIISALETLANPPPELEP
jgi:hypothetical protein